MFTEGERTISWEGMTCVGREIPSMSAVNSSPSLSLLFPPSWIPAFRDPNSEIHICISTFGWGLK
jgi:hypothetical protein